MLLHLRWLQEELFGQEELEDAGLEDEDDEGWGRPAAAAGPRGDSRPGGQDEVAGEEPDDQVGWKASSSLAEQAAAGSSQ